MDAHHDQPVDHGAEGGSGTQFPTSTRELPAASETATVELDHEDELTLEIAPVAKRIGGDTVRMLAYNGSIPGPTLRVREGSAVLVRVVNRGDLEATVHWHGLRLENRYDGTHETQAPIPIGGEFTYRIEFPDPGLYWYHPHIREDYGQELGLYGNIVVHPSDPDYWPPAHREVAITLDDILIEDGQIASFDVGQTTYAAMGRFGNVMLIAGDTNLSLDARRGEVVRLYLTNTANTRVFNVALPGAQLKLVGGDSGRVEREALVHSVLLAPSERAVVDVFFAEQGDFELEHRTPNRTYTLATIAVREDHPSPVAPEAFQALRTSPEWVEERRRLAAYLNAAPDKTIAFVAEMDLGAPEGPVVYVCPMHPDVVSEAPARCPKCGMALIATAAPSGYVCPMHPEVVSEHADDRCPKCGMKLVAASLVDQPGGQEGSGGHVHEHAQHPHEHGHAGHEPPDPAFAGIEWEDDMVEVNRMTTPANMRWRVVDRTDGAVGAAISWRFRVGDRVKIRLVNETDSDHPMHHPFHIHGAGRFVVLARDGIPEPNLCWKDTVLVRTGETVDILLDVTNPGIWMAHCHIAEHHESGMMFSFFVEP